MLEKAQQEYVFPTIAEFILLSQMKSAYGNVSILLKTSNINNKPTFLIYINFQLNPYYIAYTANLGHTGLPMRICLVESFH